MWGPHTHLKLRILGRVGCPLRMILRLRGWGQSSLTAAATASPSSDFSLLGAYPVRRGLCATSYLILVAAQETELGRGLCGGCRLPSGDG